MVDVYDVICGTCICNNIPYKPIKYLAYMSYTVSLMCIFVSSTYMPIICEVHIAVGCILAYVYKSGWICRFSIKAV